MPTPDPRADERASLHGLTPEEALRALLAVRPDNPEDDSHQGDGDAVTGNDEASD
jgi:hypothetical protein